MSLHDLACKKEDINIENKREGPLLPENRYWEQGGRQWVMMKIQRQRNMRESQSQVNAGNARKGKKQNRTEKGKRKT